MSCYNIMFRSLWQHNLNGVLFFAMKYTSITMVASFEERLLKQDVINKTVPLTKYCSTSSIINTQYMVSTIHEKWSVKLKRDEIPDADFSVKCIIEHVLGLSKAYEYDLNLQTKITEDQEIKINTLCECRLARMPLQYIIKEWDFRDLHLEMCPPVFIPRPETEELVDLILKSVSVNSVFLEVGCGSGAISLSLLKALPKAQIIAIDQSRMACNMTRKNAQLNGITSNIEVINSKLNEDGTLSQPLPLDQVDVLVSNPPYVPTAQMLDLQPEIKLYEDLRALEAGPDGLRVIKALLRLAQTVLKPCGRIFLEVDSTHPKLVEKWLSEHQETNIKFVNAFKDFCGKDRFIELKKM